jgi:methylmalonyl-CoA mutase
VQRRKRKIQIKTLENLQKANAKEVQQRLDAIQTAIKNENLFDHLMEATKVCTLDRLLLLFEVVQYRRNM